jgi:D-inositol-3-phosphate glycosyltransferase
MAERHGIALLCTTQSLGGIELNVLRIASWLNERGHRCLIATVENAPLLHRAREMDLDAISIGRPPRYGALRTAKALWKTLEKHSHTHLILNSPRDMNLGVLTKRFSRGALALLQLQHMQIAGSKRDVFHSWEYDHLDAWVAPLGYLARQVATHTTIPDERVHVLPFGIDLRRFDALPARDFARRQLELPDSAVICGIVGRYDEGKGQEYLLYALAQHPALADVHALLIGEDTRGESQNYGETLRTLARDLRLTERVHFRPFMDAVELAYAAMDMFTLTSISESYGMVTIEAMASGLPVIATNAAGTPDIIEHGRTGLLMPIRDSAALAHSISMLREQQNFAAKLAANAREEAFQRFSHEVYCDGLETVFAASRTL